MTRISDSRGNQADAFDLITTKKFAWQILHGEKDLDFRDLTPLYIRKFLVWHGTLQETLDAAETKDCDYIHFHNNSNTWFLDVKIGDIFIFGVHPQGIPILHRYGCHDYDEAAEEYAHKSVDDPDIPFLFAFELKGVVNTSLCPISEVEQKGRKKVIRVLK